MSRHIPPVYAKIPAAGALGWLAAITATIAVAVGTIITVSGLSNGLSQVFRDTASDGRAVILSPGARFVGTSTLSPARVAEISEKQGVARDNDGLALVSKDVRTSVSLQRRGSDVIDGVIVRGVSPPLFAMRPQIKIVDGRMFSLRDDEVIVGRRAQAKFADTKVGDSIRYEDETFEIVGTFESGDWYESGFICDADVLLRATGRRAVHSILATLKSPAAFGAFDHALGFFDFQVLTEAAYYDRLDRAWSGRLRPVSRTVVAATALCAAFSIFALTNAWLRTRRDAMAALRQSGTSAIGVALPILAMVTLSAGFGGLVGVVLAWALFGGTLMTAGYTDSSVIYEITFSFPTFLVGVTWAVALGLVGATFPALYAAMDARASTHDAD